MRRTDKLRDLLKDNQTAYITAYPDIFYYSGFESPDCSLLISKKEAILITDSRYFVQAKIQAPDFEIFDVKNKIENLEDRIGDIIGFEEENISVREYERLKKIFPKKEFVPMQKIISFPRRTKSSEEIEKIKQAESLGDMAFSYILERIAPGRSEKEIALEIEYFMRNKGASATSFETIVASGVRSCMPHGVASEKIIQKGDVVTLDFGCVLDGYCSDMTRTIGVGEISDEAKYVYSVVKQAQEAAFSKIEKGVFLKDVDKAARDVIIKAGYGDNFGHALGHSVGIQIHENPCFSPSSKDVLEDGMVLSVEPGIYIDGQFGVRIEDLIAFYDGKMENLTKSSKDLYFI